MEAVVLAAGMASRYGVYSLNDLVSKKLDRAIWSYGDITEMDGPMVPHYKDLEFMKEQDMMSHNKSWDEDSFQELSAEEKKAESKSKTTSTTSSTISAVPKKFSFQALTTGD